MKAIVIVIVAAVALIGLGWTFANSHYSQGAAVETAHVHPEKDGAQFQKTGSQEAVDATSSNARGSNISFEGAELPNGQGFGPGHHGPLSKKGGSEWNDPQLDDLRGENEVVGRYVHRQMVYEKAPSVAKNVKMNDDLLIMEGSSEDRLSAAIH